GVRLPELLQRARRIDGVRVGLNQLHLAMKLRFLFESAASGRLQAGAGRIKRHGMRSGRRGVARVRRAHRPAAAVLVEHVRLGSEIVILSRSFRANVPTDEQQGDVLAAEIAKLREWEEKLRKLPREELMTRSDVVRRRIFEVARSLRA